MSEPTHFDVFLSHNSLDKPLVEQIAQRLVDEPKLRPFLDQWHLIPGVAWQPELEDALRRSKTVAVFIGPSGNGAREARIPRHPVLRPEADVLKLRIFGSAPSDAWSIGERGRSDEVRIRSGPF